MSFKLKPIYLGRVFGVPIRAHYSWLPVFPFYAWAISSVYLPNQVRGLPLWEYWVLGFITTTLLFVSVLVHELAHSLMARAEGIGTGNITLYMFGGLATLDGQPARPSSEFKIAVVGPAASFIIGTVFFALDELLLKGTHHLGPAQVLRHLGIVNWYLAGFNILPGLPLDGGRVLRAVLWHLNKNYNAATRVAVRSGPTIAVALVVGGGYLFLIVDWVTGLWSVTIGLMLGIVLLTSEGLAAVKQRAKRGTVEEAMSRDVILVSPDMKVQEFIDRVLKNNHHTSFAVGSRGRLHGVLVLEEMKETPESEWSRLTAEDVMRPVDESMFVCATASLSEARAKLSHNGIGRVLVLDSQGLIVGQIIPGSS